MTTLNLAWRGNDVAFAGATGLVRRDFGSELSWTDEAVLNPLERLIQISLSNDRLMAELARSRRRLVQALGYAGDPQSRAELGVALVTLARKRQDRILEQLRANRREALELLADLTA